MKFDKRVIIRGKRYRVRTSSISNKGECDKPNKKAKEIRIHPSLSGEELIEILLHEMLHAGFWDTDEEAVEEWAKDAARALFQLGVIEECQES